MYFIIQVYYAICYIINSTSRLRVRRKYEKIKLMVRKNILILVTVVVALVVSAVFLMFPAFLQETKKIEIKNAEITAEENTIVGAEENSDAQKDVEEIKEETVSEEGVVAEADEGNKADVAKESVEKKEEVDTKEVAKVSGIIQKNVSWGYQNASGRKIDTVIIHSSYNALGGDEYDVDKLIKEYKDYGVAPHYLIDRQGGTYQLVQDKNIAYHAGTSSVPDGRTNVNNFSLGIEMMNTKTDEYSAAQYSALNKLISNIKTKYKIKYVLGHNQIAPGRKDDPWNFKWGKLE